MKFFTGAGDSGTSTFYGASERHSKTDPRFAALGSIDELNSYLGICRALATESRIQQTLKDIQEDLFTLQAEIGSAIKPAIKSISKEKVAALEKMTEEFGAEVGELHSFIIPGGSPLSAHLDYARTLARKTEREVLTIASQVGAPTLAYLNRLSSVLFVLARLANKNTGMQENEPSYS